MADNTNKVTIDVEWFDELRRCENEVAGRREADCVNCHIAKDRDELKAKLSNAEDEGYRRGMQAARDRLAAAERCIEDIENECQCWNVAYDAAKGGGDFVCKIEDIIRAWREKREAK